MSTGLPVDGIRGPGEGCAARTTHNRRRPCHLYGSGDPAELLAGVDSSVTAASADETGSDHAQGQSGVRALDPADTEIGASARAALSRGPSPLRSVRVIVATGRVILHGRVPSFYLKQVAQEAARRVLSNGVFENRLVVDGTRVRCSGLVDEVV